MSQARPQVGRQDLFVGIDVGGTSLDAVATAGESGEIVAYVSIPTQVGGGPEVLGGIVEIFGMILDSLGGCCPTSVGIGIPGVVDYKLGTVRDSVNLGIGSEPYPLTSELLAKFDIPVIIENDLKATALGAWDYYRTQTSDLASLVFLGIGTGLAAGAVFNGRVLRGSSGKAGEIGHVPFGNSQGLCHCGQYGCLEASVSGWAIGEAWPGSLPAADLFDRALAGEDEALAIAQPIINRLTHALSWLFAVYDPQLLIVGGGVGTASDSLVGLVLEEIKTQIVDGPVVTAASIAERLKFMPRDQKPGAMGAAVLAAQYGNDLEGGVAR